jgi:XTP/dITP diphosphohydrolase
MAALFGFNKLVFASANQGKARELQAMLGQSLGEPVELILQGELGVESIEETGTTFIANALLKARHAASVTGLAALADDSGLAVDALDGAPGVYSARYAGPDASDEDNVRKLLKELADVPSEQRAARFCCALALVRDADDQDPICVAGEWRGRIAFEPAGVGGFGYDPVFIDLEANCTSAELAPDVKNSRSHRAKALQALQQLLAAPDS